MRRVLMMFFAVLAGSLSAEVVSEVVSEDAASVRFRQPDGVTVTLHTPEDIPVFQSFDRTAQNLTGKSLRLNVFDEVGTVICRPEWQVKDHMRWIPNCPLPEGEVLMRYQPSKNP